MKDKIKLLEITAFSAGFCGVWTRVFEESKLLSKKGYEVHVFSSNIKRGSDKLEYAPKFEKKEDVKIHRFPIKGQFGQNTFFWDYESATKKLNPDIIITHAYRQYYATKALKLAKKLNIPCILVTHAPFLNKKLRNWKLNTMVSVYDKFIGKKIINKYNKVLSITKWEIPNLLRLGCKRDKIIHIPNGVPKEFFQLKSRPAIKNKILFLGRIAPIKGLSTLIQAIKLLKEKNISVDLEIIGPAEENYQKYLKSLIKKLNLEKQIHFYDAIYNLKEKITKIDSCDIFVLPSKREGMPQTLIEVMSRAKITISSATDGGKEIIQHKKNGFLFKIGDYIALGDSLEGILKMSQKEKIKIQKNAKNSVKQFSWEEIINKIDSILKQELIKK